jgi:hypothetical protein
VAATVAVAIVAAVAVPAAMAIAAAARFLARSIAMLLRRWAGFNPARLLRPGLLLAPLVVAGRVIPVHLPFNPLRCRAIFNPAHFLRPGLLPGPLVVARRVISVHLPFRPSLGGCAGFLPPIGLGIALLAE